VRLVIYEPVDVDATAFVDFWASRYDVNEGDDEFYKTNIGQELTKERIIEWFEWKNGLPLSGRKLKSVMRNFVERLDRGGRDEDARELLDRFREGGVIWRIFWVHLLTAGRFPIYDQHVHRAMRFIQGLAEEIPKNDGDKIRAYLDDYIPFHTGFSFAAPRAVDKALWAFGRFLSGNDLPVRPPAVAADRR